jgi:hypothetical protein
MFSRFPATLHESKFLFEFNLLFNEFDTDWNSKPPVIVTPKYDGFYFESHYDDDNGVYFTSKGNLLYVPPQDTESAADQAAAGKKRTRGVAGSRSVLTGAAQCFMGGVLAQLRDKLDPRAVIVDRAPPVLGLQCEFCLVPKGSNRERIELLLHWPFPATMSHQELITNHVDVRILVHGCLFDTSSEKACDVEPWQWLQALMRQFPSVDPAKQGVVNIAAVPTLNFAGNTFSANMDKLIDLLSQREGVVCHRSSAWVNKLRSLRRDYKQDFMKQQLFCTKTKAPRLLGAYAIGYTEQEILNPQTKNTHRVVSDVICALKSGTDENGKPVYAAMFVAAYADMFDIEQRTKMRKPFLHCAKVDFDELTYDNSAPHGLSIVYDYVMKLAGKDCVFTTSELQYQVTYDQRRAVVPLMQSAKRDEKNLFWFVDPVACVLKFNSAWFLSADACSRKNDVSVAQSVPDDPADALKRLHLQAAAIMHIDHEQLRVQDSEELDRFYDVYKHADSISPEALVNAISDQRLFEDCDLWTQFVTGDTKANTLDLLQMLSGDLM